MNITAILLIIGAAWNIITFSLMGIDKRKAVKHKHRISERSLFLCAFLFGGAGILCGMLVFRHKTKHWSFRILVPLAIITDIVAIYYLLQNLL